MFYAPQGSLDHGAQALTYREGRRGSSDDVRVAQDDPAHGENAQTVETGERTCWLL